MFLQTIVTFFRQQQMGQGSGNSTRSPYPTPSRDSPELDRRSAAGQRPVGQVHISHSSTDNRILFSKRSSTRPKIGSCGSSRAGTSFKTSYWRRGTRTTSTTRRRSLRRGALRSYFRAVPAGGRGLSRSRWLETLWAGGDGSTGFNAYVVEFMPSTQAEAGFRVPSFCVTRNERFLFATPLAELPSTDGISKTFEVSAVQDALDSLLRLAPPADE